MTLEEIRRSDKDLLIPADVAEVLGCHPFTVSVKAKDGTLPFPFFRSGNRTKIPREAFLKWIQGGAENVVQTEACKKEDA